MDKTVITLGGIASILIIYWFFFGKKDEMSAGGTDVSVTVDGGYKPSLITVPKDKPVHITFLRKDPNPCLEEVIFPEYKIKEYLPVGKPVTVTLPPPQKSGDFHCAMNMYHGKIAVL